MKRLFRVIAVLVLPVVAIAGDVVVTSVTAQQRYPWNGLVDITVTVEGAAIDDPNTVWSFIASNAMTKSSIPISHITKNGTDVGAGSTWTRKYIWDAKADVGAIKIDDVALSVDVAFMSVQLWENGPYWATCNVGASKPEEYGYYFWWGDTVGYKRNASNDDWVSVKDGSLFSFRSGICPTYSKDIASLQSAGYIDSTGHLVAAHDAATAHLGAPWRMPTDAEFSALINNCDTEWTLRNGVSGRLVKGRGAYASKSIFLPAAGYGRDYFLCSGGRYWSSTSKSDSSYYACGLCFLSGDFFRIDENRYFGMSVRPVRGFAQEPAETVVVTFDSNGGESTPAPRTVVRGQELGELPVVTRAGCELTGWFTAASGGNRVTEDTVISEDVTFFAQWRQTTELVGVQLWENGPYWAECNVGASKPEEYGYYFWWGDTVGYKRNASDNGWVSVKDGSSYSFSDCPTYGKDNSSLQSAGYIDSTGNLVASHDAATAHLGAPWRMPTDAEFSALISNCETIWTTRNGVYGRLVTGKGNYSSKSIFLPAAGFGTDSYLDYLGLRGYYWSSTSYSGYSYGVWYLYFSSSDFYRYYVSRRFDGRSVRPVRGFAR